MGSYPQMNCTDNPVFSIGVGFDNVTKSIGPFSGFQSGGYKMDGHKYTTEICFSTINCKFITLYAAELVTEDNWHYDHAATYGVIGMAPGSFIWTGFADPNTQRAKYSIALGRVNMLG